MLHISRAVMAGLVWLSTFLRSTPLAFDNEVAESASHLDRGNMQNLSNAVFHWLEYQRCVGFDRFLNESALATPIIGYLTSAGWETKKETDYGIVCSTVTRGKCYADFSFMRGNELLVLETKFFKTSSQNKVFDDFVRLAVPSNPSLRSLALVAFSKSKPAWGPYAMLLGLQGTEAIEVDPHKRFVAGGKEGFSLAYNEKEFNRLLEFAQVPISAVRITCLQRAESEKYGVVLFEVQRLTKSPSSP